MKSIRSFPAIALVAACGALGVLSPSSAQACGGEWYPMFQVDPRIQGVNKAEDALDEGRPVAAAGLVVRMIPHIKQLDPVKAKIVQRAARVLAVTVARHDGALLISREVPGYAQGTWLGRTEAERRANLEWAAKTLRAVATARHDDPAARTELAEALSRLDEGRTEARAILEELATKDLITSADGYAALATLRQLAGDDAGRRAALERCKSMARDSVACEPARAT